MCISRFPPSWYPYFTFLLISFISMFANLASAKTFPPIAGRSFSQQNTYANWVDTFPTLLSSAFRQIPLEPKVIKFKKKGFKKKMGGHFQGIQQLDNHHMIITGSSVNKAYFIIVFWENGIQSGQTGRIIKLVHINDDFPDMIDNHASGIQLMGNILAIGTENSAYRDKSSIVFYKLSDPKQPKPIGKRLMREGDTAGAVAITQLENKIILAVGGWDCDRIDFYLSNGKNIEAGNFEWNFQKSWYPKEKNTTNWINPDWRAYQGLNFLKGNSDKELYLAGFGNSDKMDWADIYQLDLNLESTSMLNKVAQKQVRCQNRASFQNGAGLIFTDSTSRISLFAVDKYWHSKMYINYFW